MSTESGPTPHPSRPYGSPAVPPAQRVPMRGAALAGAALAVVSAALLLAGSFLTLRKSVQFSQGKQVLEVDVSSWTTTITPPPAGEEAGFFAYAHNAIYGIPLSVVAVALLAGALLTFLSAPRDAPPRRGGTARLVMLGAAAAAALSVLTLSMEVDAALSLEGASPNETVNDHTTYGTGAGYWLLVGGAVVAIGAAALVFLRQRVDSDRTPPQGFPAPGGYTPPPGQGWRPAQPVRQQPAPRRPHQVPPPASSTPPSEPPREHPLEADAPTQWRPAQPPEKPTGAPDAPDQHWEPPSSGEFTSRLEPDKPEPEDRD